MLDRAGARAINKNNFKKIRELPNNYKHTILVNKFIAAMYHLQIGKAKIEHKIGNIRADIYYPLFDLAVEVDRGTETHKTLKKKASKYNEVMSSINCLIFITNGNEDRNKTFAKGINNKSKLTVSHFSRLGNVKQWINKNIVWN